MADLRESALFVSYARADAEFVTKLVSDLRGQGVEIWVDQDIPVGADWDASIEQALQQSRGVLAVLSPSSIQSRNVLDELRHALDEHKALVPILLRACKPPYWLRRVQHIDFTGDYDTALRRLLTQLQRMRGVAEPSAFAGHTGAAPRASLWWLRLMTPFIVSLMVVGLSLTLSRWLKHGLAPESPAAIARGSLADSERESTLGLLRQLEESRRAFGENACHQPPLKEPAVYSGATSVGFSIDQIGVCYLALAVVESGAPVTLTLKHANGTSLSGDTHGVHSELRICPGVAGEYAFAATLSDQRNYGFAVYRCENKRDGSEADPEVNGQALLIARMKRLRAEGCSEVLLAPDIRRGTSSLRANLYRRERCVTILAVSSRERNPLMLEMKTAFGEVVRAPSRAPQVEIAHCPLDDGVHLIRIEPTTDDPYAVASMSCPRRARAP